MVFPQPELEQNNQAQLGFIAVQGLCKPIETLLETRGIDITAVHNFEAVLPEEHAGERPEGFEKDAAERIFRAASLQLGRP